MKTIDSVLQQFAPRTINLGRHSNTGGVAAAPARALDVDGLRGAVEAVRRDNGRAFWAIFSCVAGLYAVLVSFLLRWPSQPATAAAAIGASGVSLPFLLRYMMSLWKSKVRADAVMVFAATLDPATLHKVLRAMQENEKTIASR